MAANDKHRPRRPRVLTVGPDIQGKGGISAVLQAYRRSFGDFRFAATNSRHGSAAGAVALAWLLLRLPFFRLAGYNTVHAHGASGKSFIRKRIVLGWARMLGFRTIFHNHGGGFRVYAESAGMEKIARQLAGYDAIAALTDDWARFFRDSLGCANVHVIPNIVEKPSLTAPSPGEFLNFIFLGKLCPEKGVYDLLEAIRTVAAKYPGRFRLIVGGNGETDRFLARAAELGLDSYIDFRGWIGPAAKAEIFGAGGVLVLPSYIEGMPISILEACSYGLPSISTPVGGIPELVADGESGILVTPGDHEALAAAMARYIGSPALAAQHGEAAHLRALPHFPEEVRRALDSLYASI